jgi:hypothetical protein
MFGFLLKLLLTIVLIGGAIGFVYLRLPATGPHLGSVSDVVNQARNVDLKVVSQAVSSQLDKLITHTDRSPMVMGIEITNKSLEAMVDTLRSLPPEELAVIRQFVCQPASDSAQY